MINFWDPWHPACALRFYKNKKKATSSEGGSVRLAQPWFASAGGVYSCRAINLSESFLLSNRYGCWTMNQFTCPGGDLPFKWRNECWLGEIDLPDHLCVQGLRLSGTWDLA